MTIIEMKSKLHILGMNQLQNQNRESFAITMSISSNSKITKHITISWLEYMLGKPFVQNVLRIAR